ncbi:response regulator [Arthrospira platensis FACHB-971]|nr:response regulator [Arthrospira platensis FACHB-971]MBD2668321.1 response regulator [Arthrospira platensis FACHB-439]MBD2709515.1 response regulator [Arthrospira platensis FACHB-835]
MLTHYNSANEGENMKTILVVEDNPINWQIFQRIITRKGGMLACHTEDVETVINMATSKQADLILMDIYLNNSYYEGQPIDGINTQMLKANPETASLPVILVTAQGDESDREYFLAQSGADGYIPKPIIDHQAFINQIKATIAGDVLAENEQ